MNATKAFRSTARSLTQRTAIAQTRLYSAHLSHHPPSTNHLATNHLATADMTTSIFKYMDPSTYNPSSTEAFIKPWAKVDGPGYSFKLSDHQRSVENIRGRESDFSTDTSGFAVYQRPTKENFGDFSDDEVVRNSYYQEVEEILKQKLSGIKKVVIFDHTIRRNKKTSPRAPVQQVHVDQTPSAAAARVRRHLPANEAEELLKGRYQIINVWRPISHAASDFPLAVVDYRSTQPKDLVKVDLLYPSRDWSKDDDDRGKERAPDPTSVFSTAGYEVKGETYGVAPSEGHKFYYVKDMVPDETMFIKCFDSWSEALPNGKKGIAAYTPHTAFVDPQTPADAPGRESIEVRCLVFYE